MGSQFKAPNRRLSFRLIFDDILCIDIDIRNTDERARRRPMSVFQSSNVAPLLVLLPSESILIAAL